MLPVSDLNQSTKDTIHQFWMQNHAGRLPLGMGCAYIQDYPAQVRAGVETLETAYELGIRYFDTARAYGNSEYMLGAFVPSVPRESIFIATKFNLPRGGGKTPREAAEQAAGFLNESLERLKTAYLDLYQVHDSTDMPLVFEPGGVLEVLLDAKRKGLIRRIGMAIRTQAILEYAVADPAFDTILTWGEFSPFNQDAAGLIDRAGGRGMGVINASPLLEARRRKLDLSDPRILAAVIQFPMTNPGIDMNLTGPSNAGEIRATVEAAQAAVDRSLWAEWKPPEESMNGMP